MRVYGIVFGSLVNPYRFAIVACKFEICVITACPLSSGKF